jgi:hypothetical protein
MSDSAPARISTVLLYSDDPEVRHTMRLAIGTRPAPDLQVRFIEAGTHDEVIRLVDSTDLDLPGDAEPGSASPGRSRTRSSTARRPVW